MRADRNGQEWLKIQHRRCGGRLGVASAAHRWLTAPVLDGREKLRNWKGAGQAARPRRGERDRRKLERAALAGVDGAVDADHRADHEGAGDTRLDVSSAEEQSL